jgi:hypothetical protein
MTLACEERCAESRVWRRNGFHEGARRAEAEVETEERAVAAVEPLEAVDAADTEPWFELDCRTLSGDAWKSEQRRNLCNIYVRTTQNSSPKGSRDISDIPLRHPIFTKMT